jgi:putative tryptophan/tyrosine transport system substrate-binding protein
MGYVKRIGFVFARRCCHVVLVLCVALLSGSGGLCQAMDTVAVLLSEHGGYYSDYLEALNRALVESLPAGRSLRVIELPAGRERPDEAVLSGVSTIIAVGVQAMRAAAVWENAPPVLNVLVPRVSYEKLLAESGRNRRRAQFSAIYLDQPLSRQINLIAQTLPGKRRIAALLGPDSAMLLPRLRAVTARTGLELVSEEVSSESEIIPALSRLLSAGDLLLALPDSVVFTRDTARSVLLTTYRYQKPLIGFSHAYVNSGALAAVFSTPAQIARQTAELLRALPPGRAALPGPLFPTYFSVAVNRSVARALVLDIPSDALLQAMLSGLPEVE